MARSHVRNYCDYADANFDTREKGESCPFCGREIGGPLDAAPITEAEVSVTAAHRSQQSKSLSERRRAAMPKQIAKPKQATKSGEQSALHADGAILTMVRGLGWYFLWMFASSVLIGISVITGETGWMFASGASGLVGFGGLLVAYVKTSER